MPDNNELVNMADQFRGLDMSALIGGPLKAACEAQVMLAASTADFIENVGLEAPDKNGVRKVRTTAFSFTRTASPDEKGNHGTEEVKMAVPLLSIVKIPSLMIQNVNVTFDMEVKSSVSSEKISDKSGSIDANAGLRIGPFSMNVKIKGSVSCHESNTRKSDNSAKYHVEVSAKDTGMPEGLARMLDILASASEPVSVSASGAGKEPKAA